MCLVELNKQRTSGSLRPCTARERKRYYAERTSAFIAFVSQRGFVSISVVRTNETRETGTLYVERIPLKHIFHVWFDKYARVHEFVELQPRPRAEELLLTAVR